METGPHLLPVVGAVLLPAVGPGGPASGHGVLPEQVAGTVHHVQLVVETTGIAHYVA